MDPRRNCREEAKGRKAETSEDESGNCKCALEIWQRHQFNPQSNGAADQA